MGDDRRASGSCTIAYKGRLIMLNQLPSHIFLYYYTMFPLIMDSGRGIEDAGKGTEKENLPNHRQHESADVLHFPLS